MEKIKDLSYCSKNSTKNNIKLFEKLIASKETNSLDFAHVNLLINNALTVKALLSSKQFENIVNAIPSQLKTLLCLDTFNTHLSNAVKKNPKLQENYDLLLSTDLLEVSKSLNSKTNKSIDTTGAVANNKTIQTCFEF